jgi:hypothetical protein
LRDGNLVFGGKLRRFTRAHQITSRPSAMKT